MQDLLRKLKEHVIKQSSNPRFVHHEWFSKWHLEIVERIALELCQLYPAASKDTVIAMVWMHDYGKIINFDEQYESTQVEGKRVMLELGFIPEFTEQVMKLIGILDSKMATDLRQSPLTVQIIATADAASHLFGPFYRTWWKENASKTCDELMNDNFKKVTKDWERKLVLPEARQAFAQRHQFHLEQIGQLPNKFIL